MIPVALLGVVMVASPLRWLLERAGRFASPGGVLVGAVALVGAALVRAAASEGTWSDELPWSAAEFIAAFLACDLVLMCLLGAWRRRVVTGGSWRAVAGALVVMTATGATSALTLARRQTVAVAVSAHSALASVIVYGFQRVFDRDRDGHSALFNGGDCNDRDPRVRPGLRDVPGNGVDEDCSGRDAVALREETDGAYAPPPAAITRARPSFVLLTVDTLRPDHLGAYGYARPTTPHLDAFARQSALFTRAYTTSPRTLRAFASVWTGRFPSRVAWGADNLFPALEESNATLAETLREAGYATGAFCDSDYFRATVGFFQGYDAVHEGRAFKSDPAETARAFEDWLDARERSPQPFFAWLHLLEPHFPYRHRVGAEGFGPLALDRYDDEVARADAALGQVLRAVDAFGAAHPDRPLVVVMTADHGEALGEQGRTGHGVDLHEESVRIPLIVRAPGVAPGPRSALVSLLDVHATVLNLAGLPVRGAVQSRSLVRHLVTTTSRVEGERLFTEVTPDGFIPHEQKALYRPPWKLLWDVRRNTWELYNLVDDRAEARNVYDERRDVADGLREELLAWAGEAWRNRRDALLAAARLRELPAMQRRLGVRFGDVMELVGCDLPEGGVQAGGTIRVTLYLRALAPSRRLLRLGMWFESEDGRSLGTRFHASHYPVQGQYRTTEWAPGELLRDEVTLRVSPHERSMRLRLWFNVIEDGTFQALESDQSTGANHSVSLGEIEIVGQSPSVVSHDE
jgi:arylsulfatase A-like enzyme